MATLLVACLLLGGMSTLSGCTTYNNFKNAFAPEQDTTQDATIKIGIYESITGQTSEQGKQEVMGIELAHALYPTVLDMPVELIYGDNQSNMYVGETVIQELLSQKPAVVLGSCGEVVSMVAGDYIKAVNTPAISISATNPLLTSNNSYYFSATFPEARQGEVMADFAYQGTKKDVVATVRVSNDNQALATTERFAERMRRITQNQNCVVGDYALSVENPDFATVIERIRESGAKAVFLAMSPSMAQSFLQAAIDLKMTHILWLGPRTWDNEDFLEFVNAQSKLDIAYPADFNQDTFTTMTTIFEDAYREKYGEDAVPSESTVVAFDAYLLALDAIRRAQEQVETTTEEDLREQYEAGSVDLKAAQMELDQAKEKGMPTGRQIREALMATKNFVGASGIITYDGSNEAQKSISINRITGGEVQDPYTLNR